MMAVEEVHVTSAEEQRKWLDHMQKQCLQESYNFTFIPEAPTGHCPQIWDGLMCWPATPAGTLFKQPCAHYFLGFNHKANASKYCTLTGEWFQDETNMPWTNYSQCYSEPTVSLPVNFTGFTNGNPFISDYVPILKIIAQVGYTVSLIALVIAFSILVTIKKLRCPRNMLHLHLFVSFIMRASMAILKDVTFVSGVGLNQEFIEKNGTSYLLDQNNWICKAVISVWQYSLMANYSWILMEGLYLHNLIFLAIFSDASSILLYVILGWGLPAIFVFLWILARVFLEDILCWTTHTSYLLFLLMIRGPTTFSIILNFLLFLNIVRVLLLKLQASVCEETHTYRRWAKSTLVLVPLFGVHYAIFLGMGIGTQPHLEIAWLFCDQLFASFQGFFVALLYCFMNGEVRSELKRQWPQPDGVTYNENEMGRRGCSGALLDMLAEVASQTLHSDPSVKSPVKRPALKTPEINCISNKRKQRTPCRGRTGEGETMDLEQLQSLTANHLLKLFSEFDGDEIRRTFTFTCFIEPELCHQQFSSFGSEGKARQQMKSHLLEHVQQLELKAERGFELRIEPVKVRRRRLAEALHINRRHKNGTKIKVEPIIKSEPVDENDSSLPNKENNVSSVLENYPIVKLNQKTEKLINSETVENVNESTTKDIPETEDINDSCTVQNSSVVERACDAEEKNKVDEGSHGIYDEHNYVAIDSSNVANNITATVSDEDEKKCKGTENKLKPIFGYDLQKQEKQDKIKKEPHVSDKSPAADIGKFMIAETLLDMVMVCVLEDDQLQLKQLPCVGQEIDVNTSQCAPYKMIRSDDLPVVQDNRKSDPQQYSDEVIREINCEKSIERDEYIQKKKPKGKAKFIGQSKAEKEMAIHLIETMKRKGNTESLECHICNPPRSFTAPTTLISHYRSHAGIKPYECRICHSVFTRQHSLNYHMLIHSNQTRFTCSDCGRKFRHPSHFKEHRRRHTGESPYECSDCMLRFKTRNTYKRHLKTRHGKVLTTSGGLIILSEEEFRQVRTLPRTPQSTSLIQIKQEQQIGKKRSRKGKARIKIGGKRRRLEPYEVMEWKQMDEETEGNELNYDNEALHEATASISIPTVEIDGHKSELDELSCISNVENEITLPLSKSDTCEKSFQDIVEEAMRQSSISFTDETDDKVNDKANVVVLDVPVANTENLFGSKNDQFENELPKIPSEDEKSGWNMVGPQQKGKEKNKAEQKSNSKNTNASQLKSKPSKKSLILPNNVTFNPLVINAGLNQSQTMSAILTTSVQTSTFNSPTSSTAFLSKSSVLSQLDADVIKFVHSERLDIATSNTQQTTIMLLTEDCSSFTTQNYIVNEVEKNSERVLGVPQV